MANATSKLLVAGLSVVLTVSAANVKWAQTAEHAVYDVMVYVESDRVSPSVLLPAESMATRMFGGIGVRVQWATRRPGRTSEPASGDCALRQPKEIRVRMVSGRPAPAGSDVFAVALPYASDGVRVMVFYAELHEAFGTRPQLESAVLAHVLVHEITHVLQGVARHSYIGLMRAHWKSTEYARLEKGPMEFASDDAELIRIGLLRDYWTLDPSTGCQ
jgi:hypothetical protein